MGLLEGAIIALIIAVIAGALGFTNIAAGAAVVSRWLFIIFLVIALLLFAAVIFGVSLAL